MSRRKTDEEYRQTGAFRFFRWLSGSKDAYVDTVEMKPQTEAVETKEEEERRIEEHKLAIEKAYDSNNRAIIVFNKIYRLVAAIFTVFLLVSLIYAVSYLPQIGDADNAINRFASDTFRLDAGIQALQGLAAGAAVAQGAFGLLGIENEKTQQAILKVQSAIAVLNGVQTIANMLQRDSALILRLKQISTEVLTAATAKNTIATAANSAITKKDTIITQAWNVAKAVSKALLGDFTGLVLVGGTALA